MDFLNQINFDYKGIVEAGYYLYVTHVDIYYKAADEYHFYLWNDGEYSFIISTNDQLSNEDIDQMINNIVAK